MSGNFHQIAGYCVVFMGLFWIIIVSKFFKKLKKEYPDDYANLGSPGVFVNNTPSTNKKFFVFLFSSDALLHCDARMRRFIIFMRIWFILFFIVFVMTLAS